MNRTRISLIVLGLCVGLTATSLAVSSDPVQPKADGEPAEIAIPIEERVMPQDPIPLATGITCTFNCNDGTGLLYQCPDPTLGQCCGQAQPACSSHGGLSSGICNKGRLGLPCTPI